MKYLSVYLNKKIVKKEKVQMTKKKNCLPGHIGPRCEACDVQGNIWDNVYIFYIYIYI